MGTLTSFGVPNGPGRGGIIMPKVKNRFRVKALNFGIGPTAVELTQQVMTVGRPNANFNPQPVHSYNSISYYAGKQEWEPVSLKVRDDTTNSVSRLISAQLMKQMNFFEQTVPRAASAYKFEMLVDTMDGGNDMVIDQWYFEGCFIATANYETFDYSASDPMTIDMTIRYDNVTNDLMPFIPHDAVDVMIAYAGNQPRTPATTIGGPITSFTPPT